MTCACDNESRCTEHRAITTITTYTKFGMTESCLALNEPIQDVFYRVSPFSLHIRDGRLEPCIPCWMSYAEYERYVIRLEPLPN